MATGLHRAAVAGDAAELRRQVALGADLNAQVNQWTPLQLAARCGHVEAIRVLVEAGARWASAGHTPLHLAVNEGHVQAVRVLVELGMDINAPTADCGERPLHTAAFSGQARVLRALVQLGADVGARTLKGETPLHLAAERGAMEVIRVLVELGKLTHKEATVAAKIARRAGHHEVHKFLREFSNQPSSSAAQRAPDDTEAAWQTSGCAACGNESGDAGAALKTCARCQRVKYCSVACQRSHWRVHKPSCAAGACGPSSQAGTTSSAAAGGSGQSSSAPSGSCDSEPQPHSCGLHSTKPAAKAVAAVAEATRSTQQAKKKPQPAATKEDKERQRKERMWQRKIDEARTMLTVAMNVMQESGVRCV